MLDIILRDEIATWRWGDSRFRHFCAERGVWSRKPPYLALMAISTPRGRRAPHRQKPAGGRASVRPRSPAWRRAGGGGLNQSEPWECRPDRNMLTPTKAKAVTSRPITAHQASTGPRRPLVRRMCSQARG